MAWRLVHEERAQVLPLTLIAIIVLSATTASLLIASAVNHHSAGVSANDKSAFALAEQGLAYAEGRLYSAPDTAASVLVPGTSYTPSDGQGTVTYSGTLCSASTTPSCDPKVWTLYGTGDVNGQSRTVSAQVTIPTVTTTGTETETGTVTGTDFTIWHYIYLDNPSSCTSLSGSLTINVPFYTQGCLNLSGSVKFTGSDLEVGGNLSLSGNAKIGSSSQPISKMGVHGTCSPAVPCSTANQSPIWVNAPGVQNTLSPALTKPTINLANEYASTNPGPALNHDCQTGSNVPTHFFDNDRVLNDSNGNINLFPSGVAYDCKNGSNEIKWDGTSKLTVNGPFYFDGSLSMSGNQSIVYSGQGTLYFTGGISFSGTTKLCGITNCTTQWNTTQSGNVLILVAGCQNASGGTISGCVTISGTNTLQAGIYSNNDYSISGNAVNMGPVIANTGSFSGNASQFIPVQYISPTSGAPVNTTTTTTTTTVTTTVTSDGTPLPPSDWNG